MTGRGQPLRGGRSHVPDYHDPHRRGRGRPRRFPLSTPLHLPSDSGQANHPEDEEFREDETEFFHQEEEMDKINKIQQQKMMIVTPMAQKRVRGRPPRPEASSSQPVDEELLMQEGMMLEEIPAHEEVIEAGPMEKLEEEKTATETIQVSSYFVQRGARSRQIPRKLNDFMTIRSHSKQLKLPPQLALGNPDEIEPLMPNDALMEEANTSSSMKPELKKPEEPQSSQGPPPAPRHLANKQNSRGRPANIIPPHRRPLPKDLMPPSGFPSGIKRVNILRDTMPPGPPPKRKDPHPAVAPEQSVDSTKQAPPPIDSLPPPIPPMQVAQAEVAPEPAQPSRDVKVEPPEPAKEDSAPSASTDGPPPPPPLVPQMIQQQPPQLQHHQLPPPPPQQPSTSVPAHPHVLEKKREREAGKDLPSEHFPKEKARHVSTRGLVPYDNQRDAYFHDDIGQSSSGPQQRVLTIQGGGFIEDRIGNADMMEEEELKMMKQMPQQYIQVEENGVNVMYEVDPGDVLDADDQVEIVGSEQVVEGEQYIMGRPMQKVEIVDDDDDDDLPPQLVAEGVPEEVVGDDDRRPDKEMLIETDENFDINMLEEGQSIRLHSPGGRGHDVRLARDIHGNSVFVDENGHIVELMTMTGGTLGNNEDEEQEMVEQQQPQQDDNKKKMILQQQAAGGPTHSISIPGMVGDRTNLEFSFLDNNNVCCGLCGEIVLYEKLVSDHLPSAHPEFLLPGVELEEIPYDSWLKSRLKQEMKSMENGFRHFDEHEPAGFGGSVRLFSKQMRHLRKVSQIRVNVNEMSMNQLEIALKRKLVEKMGRKVPVSLVDRLHARCDVCQAVVSLNKKFEVVHLVRHFNAWHPAEHRCTQEWKEQQSSTNNTVRRPLSLHDFAVVNADADQNNLQCIWCGMFMDRAALGMHFTEVHAQQVIVPNCSLCLQEMVMTARLMEKYGDDFGVSLPDEFHIHSSKLATKFSSEKALDKAIDKHLKRVKNGGEHEDEDGQEDADAICTTNSQQSFGRRNRLKRKFVKPCFRQICPTNSQFFEAKSACEWKCRLCHRAVYGAVISAGAIKHYKEFHPSEIDNMQYELVKARLERIGDGSMEFVHPQLVECLICNLTYALHKPFNICRAIRHLRLKHPEVMPETAGKPISGAEIAETTDLQKPLIKPEIRFGELITDPIALERFRKDNFDQQFDKVQVVYGIKKNNEPAYILLMENEKMDLKTAQEMAEKQLQEDDTVEPFEEIVVEGEEVVEMQEGDFEQDNDQFRQETKSSRMVMEFPEQLVEEVEQEDIGMASEQDYLHQYDDNNGEHVLIEENEIMNDDGTFEMIQEGEYAEIEDNRTVRYMTEEEIQEAQARGELLEFADDYAEYEEQQ